MELLWIGAALCFLFAGLLYYDVLMTDIWKGFIFAGAACLFLGFIPFFLEPKVSTEELISNKLIIKEETTIILPAPMRIIKDKMSFPYSMEDPKITIVVEEIR